MNVPKEFDTMPKLKGWNPAANEVRQALENRSMVSLLVDFTNACNANCPYCYIEEKDSIRKERRSNELTSEETKKIIDTAVELGARNFHVVGAGEPTIDKHFKELVGYAVEKGLEPVIFTNGITLANDPETLRFLEEVGASVFLKYNSGNAYTQNLLLGEPHTYKNSRGLVTAAEKRDKTLGTLLDRGFNAVRPTRLAFDAIIMKGVMEEIPEIHRYCRANNIYLIASSYIPTGRTEEGKPQFDVSRLRLFTEQERADLEEIMRPVGITEQQQLYRQLKQIDEAEFGLTYNVKPAYMGGGLCTQILGMYVDIEGNVWPCVARSRKLGNVRDGADLKKIWYEDLAPIRENFDGSCPYKAPLV